MEISDPVATDTTDTDASPGEPSTLSSAVAAVDMIDEKLIEEVRRYRVLYDISDFKYNNPRHKDNIWRQIAKDTRQSESWCKKRWYNIRDNFRKSLKKRSMESGKVSKTCRRYKYEDHLKFLLPFIREREKVSQVSSPDLSEHETEGLVDTHKIETDDKTDDESNQSLLAPHFLSMPTKKSPQSASFRENSPGTASPVMLNFFSEKLKRDESSRKVVDIIDSFLMGIGMTLRTFPDYHLNIAKSRIFEIVQEMEMKLIMERQYQSGSGIPKDASVPGASGT